jgi:hypothetical protein
MGNNDDRVLAITMAQVAANSTPCGKSLTRRSRRQRPFLVWLLALWTTCVARLRRTYYSLAWCFYFKWRVAAGGRRWQKLAGIGKPDNYTLCSRPQKVGYIYH